MNPMELAGRLENNSKQTITRYCGDLDGAIVPHALLTEAAACIREMVEWRPIETAPVRACMGVVAFFDPAHDALSALGKGRDERYELAWFDGTDWRESGTAHLYDERAPEHRPTHWLPLPPAPGAEDE